MTSEESQGRICGSHFLAGIFFVCKKVLGAGEQFRKKMLRIPQVSGGAGVIAAAHRRYCPGLKREEVSNR